ncbi:hypothetical protein ACFQ5X_51195, partial [Streptomyces kaempferi]
MAWEKRLITVRKRHAGLAATAGVLAVTALGGTSSAATSRNDAGNPPKPQARVDQAAADASDARIKIT